MSPGRYSSPTAALNAPFEHGAAFLRLLACALLAQRLEMSRRSRIATSIAVRRSISGAGSGFETFGRNGMISAKGTLSPESQVTNEPALERLNGYLAITVTTIEGITPSNCRFVVKAGLTTRLLSAQVAP